MLRPDQLKSFVREAAALLRRETDLAEFEVYSSSGEQIVARLNYTSDIPCRGVEELKSLAANGFAIRIVSRRNPRESAVAHEAGDLSLDAVRRALDRARRSLTIDPNFPGLPGAPRKLASHPGDGGGLMRLPDRALVSAAWAVVRGAAEAFAAGVAASLGSPGLILGGDVTIVRDRIALANSRFDDLRADSSAHFVSSVSVLIEALDAKGTAAAQGDSAELLRRTSIELGRQAVERALALGGGERPESGSYRVIFGPQPIAEILNYMVVPSLTAGAFVAASSAYQGRFGDRVMDARLSLFDDPSGTVRRRITCEGLPARRTTMVRDGRLIGLMANFYNANRLAADPDREEKLGPDGKGVTGFAAGNGYRLGEGGGRRFDSHPGTAATNIVMRARDGLDDRALAKRVGDGIYIGRIWYTYPINGQRAGDFTCTVSGDSYRIRNGRIAVPIAPNAIRINAHIDQVFARPIAIGSQSRNALVWGSPETYRVPAIAAEVPLTAIGVAG